MKDQFGDQMDLPRRKGFYTYERVDGIEKLDFWGDPNSWGFSFTTDKMKTPYKMTEIS